MRNTRFYWMLLGASLLVVGPHLGAAGKSGPHRSPRIELTSMHTFRFQAAL
jgi:hypothetical protein